MPAKKKSRVETTSSTEDDPGSDANMADDITEDVSDYERVRLENIRRNASFLASLGLDEEKVALDQIKPREASRRGVSKQPTKSVPVLPTRRSGRVTIERLKTELAEIKSNQASKVEDPSVKEKETQLNEMISKKNEGSYDINIDAMVAAAGNKPHERLPPEPISYLNPSNHSSVNGGKKLTALLKLTGDAREPPEKITSMQARAKQEYSSQISRLKVKEVDVAKVTESRITAVFCHPSQDKILVVAGDKVGCIGLWDVDPEAAEDLSSHGGTYRYNPHVSNIAGIHSWPEEPSKIYSVSYDGTVRCLDLGKEAFTLAFAIQESLHDVFLSDASFSWSDPHTCLVGRSDGIACLIDFRTKSTSCAWSYQVQSTKLNSVQLHPTDSNLLVCGGSGQAGSITVHDLRKASSVRSSQWKALQDLNFHNKSINAAYVSPDGKYLVSVSQDNTIRTWKNFTGSGAKPVSHVTQHDNITGRWLSTFRPTFDPKHPHALAMGSMSRPRMVEVFQVRDQPDAFALEIVKELKGEFLASVCSRNCFHPYANLIAAGNSSGRVHIWR